MKKQVKRKKYDTTFYEFGESIFNFRVVVVAFVFIRFLRELSAGQAQLYSVASDLGLHCLPLSQKRTVGLYGLIMIVRQNMLL